MIDRAVVALVGVRVAEVGADVIGDRGGDAGVPGRIALRHAAKVTGGVDVLLTSRAAQRQLFADRNRTVQYFGIDAGAIGIMDAGRAAGNDDATAVGKFSRGSVARTYFGIDAEIADLAGDQMAVLTTSVENRDLGMRLGVQATSPFSARSFSSRY